ncbi:MAG TPA: hypothetical protein VFR48_09665 [Solirubrobacteraceae bacterium]|nr:hypothetical protein [Solirubrobacteraceae bacterium]
MIVLAVLSLTGGALLVGCGTSKPAYCTQVTNLENSVKALGKVELSSSIASELTTGLGNVSKSAKELGSALKSEFSTQTSAIKSSIGTLENTAKQVSSAGNISAKAQAAAPIPREIEALKKPTSEIQEIAKSKCK